MVGGTFEYVLQQVLWLMRTTAQLIATMGIGITWMVMTARCLIFSTMDMVYFMPHVVWYLLSPNIIRRVSYRSSRTTKLRNLEALVSKQVKQEALSSGTRTGAFPWSPMNSSHEASLAAKGVGGVHHGVASLLRQTRGSEEVDRETMERWASSINPADGTFVDGLPVNVGGETSSRAASPYSTAVAFNNAFDDTLEALQRMCRHRSQQQQQQQQQAMLFSKTSHGEPSQKKSSTPLIPAASNESFTDSDGDDDVEDRMNLHNRATLDIYLPVPLDSLFRFMDQERKSDETAHVQANGTHPSHRRRGRLTRKKFPILISVTGGAWIVGCYLWNFLLARLFAARGYVVFCPDYRNFPQTTMEGMTLDISDSIAWVLNNAERYNGDLNNVTLIGQSAGAHLTMMSLLSQAQLSAYRHNAEKGIHEGVPPPSDVAYNVPRYNPRESIHRYVGLSGMYNIEGLVDHFNRRGLTTPVLYQIAGGRDQLARYTIHAYFDDRRGGDTGEVLPDNIFDFFPQRMFFVHGDADKSAPVTESATLVGVMRAAQERDTLRRSAYSEEVRRHAQRSRRLLPAVAAAAAGEVKSSATATATTGFEAASAAVPSRRATVAVFDTMDSAEGATAVEEEGFGAVVRLADSGAITYAHSQHPVNKDAAPCAKAPSSRSHSYGTGAPHASTLSRTTISPIMPPSREDRPRSPVEIGFLVVSGGRHSDAFVDECIAAGRSCCVDFLCDYEATADTQNNASQWGVHGHHVEGASGSSLSDSLWTSSSPAANKAPLLSAQMPAMSAIPDAVLPLAVPYEDRSLLLRLCTMISPF